MRRMRAGVDRPLLRDRHHAGQPTYTHARVPPPRTGKGASSPDPRRTFGNLPPASPHVPSTACRSTSRRRCAPTSNAAFWPTGSCGPVVRTAGRVGRLPFPARNGGSAPRAAVRLFTESQSPPARTHARWGLRRWGRSSGFRSRPAVVRPGGAADRADDCTPHHPPVHETRLARRPSSRSARRRGARAGRPCGHRLGWAALLARVFAPDLSVCPACGGRLRIIAALTDPASIRRYLVGVGLPPKAPPRAPPQPRFEFSV